MDRWGYKSQYVKELNPVEEEWVTVKELAGRRFEKKEWKTIRHVGLARQWMHNGSSSKSFFELVDKLAEELHSKRNRWILIYKNLKVAELYLFLPELIFVVTVF